MLFILFYFILKSTVGIENSVFFKSIIRSRGPDSMVDLRKIKKDE